MFETSQLNQEQLEAVNTLHGPLLIMAGAGSGKTRTVIHRIDHLIEKGVRPENILAITFTNKAAKELVERLSPAAKNVTATTIHAFCVKLLRQYGKALGFHRDFNIIDTDDQKKILNDLKTDLIDDIEIDVNYQHFEPALVRIIKPYQLQAKISLAKNQGIIDQNEFAKMLENDYSFTYDTKTCVDLYERYIDYCQKEYLLDFDDILLYTRALLQVHPEILEIVQNIYQYITVDEYQDTNTIQNDIIDLIARKYQNLCVVGDANQSIYKFRGAKVENIIQFQNVYPNAKVIYLNKNYRSKQTILNASNDIINNNAPINNQKVNLQSDREGNLHNINVMHCNTATQEAEAVVGQIITLMKKHHYTYKDFAIIYRNNALNQNVQRALRQNHLPYIVYNGMNFYQRKEVKDIIAYMTLCSNPHAGIFVERIINTPTRGIGATTVRKLKDYARDTNQSLARVLDQGMYAGLNATTINRLDKFLDLYRHIDLNSYTLSIADAIDALLDEAGYIHLLNDDEDYNLDIYEEFFEDIKHFEKTNDLINMTLRERISAFLQFISLQTSNDHEDSDKDQVQLLTIHSAKGLEFPVVFLIGWDSGIFPDTRSLRKKADKEEERRLAYVAVTRAKDYLFISHAEKRYVFGNSIKTGPSMFISEIEPKHINDLDYRNEDEYYA